MSCPATPEVALVYSKGLLDCMNKPILRACWNNNCPSGVSYAEHIMSLPMVMIGLYNRSGSTGHYLVAPAIAALLERTPFFTRSCEDDDGSVSWPFFIGRAGGIPIWVDPYITAEWEIHIVEDNDGPPIAILEVDNYVEKVNVLDRIARRI